MIHKLGSFVIALCMLSMQCAYAETDPWKIDVNLKGDEVQTGSQLKISFARPMIALGGQEQSIPKEFISISPEVPCDWHWLDTERLACDPGDIDLFQPSTSYSVRIRAGLTDFAGHQLAQDVVAEFRTIRPAVIEQRVYEWQGPTAPLLFLKFNVPVAKEALEEHLLFTIPGSSQMPVTATLFDSVYTWRNSKKTEWLVAASGELPAATRVSLHLKEGFQGTHGDLGTSENQELLSVDTFGDFRFRGVQCWSLDGKKIIVSATEHAFERCNPTTSVQFLFSAPLDATSVRKGLSLNLERGNEKVRDDQEMKSEETEPAQETPDTTDAQDPERSIWDDAYVQTYIPTVRKGNDTYVVELYGGVNPFITYRINGDKSVLKDSFGRSLVEDFSFSFLTDHRPPSLKIPHKFSVLESGVESHLPLYITNLKSISKDLTIVQGQSKTKKNEQEVLPDVTDIAYAFPFKTRSLLSQEPHSGVVYGTIDSEPLTGSQWIFSQLTPFNVHVKLGHFKSLIWVTSLHDGKPVEGATVTIVKTTLESYTGSEAALVSVTTDKDGVAYVPGTETLDPDGSLSTGWQHNQETLAARVQHTDGEAILPFTYDFREWEQVSHYSRKKYHHMSVWGTSAQGVYRPGDTIQYKLYVRNHNGESYTRAPDKKFFLSILDPIGKKLVDQQALSLNEFGATHGELPLSESATMGWYRFQVTAPDANSYESDALSVLVTDFTPAPFKVSIEPKAKKVFLNQKLTVDSMARLHAGGPYANAAYRLDANIHAGRNGFIPEKYSDFSFASYQGDAHNRQHVARNEGVLSQSGDGQDVVSVSESSIYFGQMHLETSVQDDRGKSVSARQAVPFFSTDAFVGIRGTSWIYPALKAADVEAIVLDSQGAPVKDKAISIIFERFERVAAKTRTSGNVYRPHYTESWEQVDQCLVRSTEAPVSCSFVPDSAGSYRARALLQEGDVVHHESSTHLWVSGPGYVLWEERGNTIEIEADKEWYAPGDTARLLLKNPYPGAEALLTTERYGVLSSKRIRLEGSVELIDFPIPDDAGPGVYVSIVIVSPRVQDAPEEPGVVDPGKPAFKQGYVQLNVRDDRKRLAITVTPEREEYRPRETARISLSNTIPSGEPLEYAVIVLDESVFDLIQGGLSYFNPYEGFKGLGSLDVSNFSLIKHLVGKIRFEKKGSSPGGGGGDAEKMRSLFKFVSFWNPELKADADGKAAIEVSLPDNLTAWRVLALAVTPEDKFGLGTGTIRVNQPTEIRGALPNQIQKGDVLTARFTVMNRTDKERTIEYSVTVSGAKLLDEAAGSTVTGSKVLAPFVREQIEVPLEARDEGEIHFAVRAGDDFDRDAVELHVPVSERIETIHHRQYIMTKNDSSSLPLAVSEEQATYARVEAAVSPSILGGIDPLLKDLQEYPYSCWEQKLSRALGAGYFESLKGQSKLQWLDAQDVVQKTLTDAASFQAPNGGMCFYVAEDARVSPYLSVYTLFGFQQFKALGYKVPSQVEAALIAYVKRTLAADVYPDWYAAESKSLFIALAMRSLADAGQLQRADVSRWEQKVSTMSAFAKAQYLYALKKVSAAEGIQSSVETSLLNQVHETSGSARVKETSGFMNTWVLSSEMRSQCGVLEVLASLYGSNASWQDRLARLVRGVYLRDDSTLFRTTQEQVFCLAAMRQYSASVEAGNGTVEYTVVHKEQQRDLLRGSFASLSDTSRSQEVPYESVGKGTIEVSSTGNRPVYTRLGVQIDVPSFTFSKRNRGIDIRREYSVFREGVVHILKEGDVLHRGELVRVDLFVGIPSDRYYVVVEDPVAGGIEPVNRDLKTSSVNDAELESSFSADSHFRTYSRWIPYRGGFWSFYHRELGHDVVRFYSEYLSPGKYHVSYVGQVIANGKFRVPPSYGEEMYMPEVYGNSEPRLIEVQDAP